jgi:hypothetical protein
MRGDEDSREERSVPVSDELSISVKDQILDILAYGATPVSSVEGFLHGEERRSVREVIRAHPDVFKVFARGFPEMGPKSLWVRLKRTDDTRAGRRGHT